MIDFVYFRAMKDVDRLSGVSKLRNYNLLEHSFMVATYFKMFASLEDVPYSMIELDMVMNHDILESVTGDLSYEVKNFSDKTKKCWYEIEQEILTKDFQLQRYSDSNIKGTLNERQFALFKFCDIFDLWVFLYEEITLGNNNHRIVEIKERCEYILSEKREMFPKAYKIFKTYGLYD